MIPSYINKTSNVTNACFPQVCEVAKVYPPAEAEGCIADEAEGPPSCESVLQHTRQADRLGNEMIG